MTTVDRTSEPGRSASSKLAWLIVGRLVTALFLFVVSLLWNRAGAQQQYFGKSLTLLLITAVLTILYAFFWRVSRNTLLQARFQLALDIVLVTWVVWNSDVIHSPYVALYIVVIAVSSLFLGSRDAMVSSVACAVAFTACALARTGLVQDFNATLDDGSLSQTIQAVGLFDIAFLVVGLLSA